MNSSALKGLYLSLSLCCVLMCASVSAHAADEPLPSPLYQLSLSKSISRMEPQSDSGSSQVDPRTHDITLSSGDSLMVCVYELICASGNTDTLAALGLSVGLLRRGGSCSGDFDDCARMEVSGSGSVCLVWKWVGCMSTDLPLLDFPPAYPGFDCDCDGMPTLQSTPTCQEPTCLNIATCRIALSCPGYSVPTMACGGPTCSPSQTCNGAGTCPPSSTCSPSITCPGLGTCTGQSTCTGTATCAGQTCNGASTCADTCEGLPTCSGPTCEAAETCGFSSTCNPNGATCQGSESCTSTLSCGNTCGNTGCDPTYAPVSTCAIGQTCAGQPTCWSVPSCNNEPLTCALTCGDVTCGGWSCDQNPTCAQASTCEAATCTGLETCAPQATCSGVATCAAETCPGINTCDQTCTGQTTCATATCSGTITCDQTCVGQATCGAATCPDINTCVTAPTCAMNTCDQTPTCLGIFSCPIPSPTMSCGGPTCSLSQTCNNVATCPPDMTCIPVATCPASAQTCSGNTCGTAATCSESQTCPGAPTCDSKPGCTLCSCPKQGDLNGNGTHDIADLLGIIGRVFFDDKPARQDQNCPHSDRADLSCDGQHTILDIVLWVDYVWRKVPNAICDPCTQTGSL